MERRNDATDIDRLIGLLAGRTLVPYGGTATVWPSREPADWTLVVQEPTLGEDVTFTYETGDGERSASLTCDISNYRGRMELVAYDHDAARLRDKLWLIASVLGKWPREHDRSANAKFEAYCTELES